MLKEPVVAAHTSNPSIWKVVAEEFKVQGHLCLCIEFKASLNYMRLNKPRKSEEVVD